ncbi:MAG: hypothetical protein IJA20_02375 [Methanocorpusculum sp.]|nr:hypothetical protein [Oscillospiraceae bacterium]MBQ3569499.1 hypothetical protein [Methanocorpusculum sp.]
MDKFFDAMDRFFSFVRKHCGAFYWVCWAYSIGLMILQLVFESYEHIETVIAIAFIPMNLISWPVFLEANKLKGLPIPVWRTAVFLPAASALLPLLVLFDR